MLNLVKFLLMSLMIFQSQCDVFQKTTISNSSNSKEKQIIYDEKFFSKPIIIPSSKLNDEEKLNFAKQLELALDEKKTKFKNATIIAEGVENNVLSLTGNNVTKEECLILMKSEVIQSAVKLGLKTLSCQNQNPYYLFSTPIK